MLHAMTAEVTTWPGILTVYKGRTQEHLRGAKRPRMFLYLLYLANTLRPNASKNVYQPCDYYVFCELVLIPAGAPVPSQLYSVPKRGEFSK
jgi:hypothetical protein